MSSLFITHDPTRQRLPFRESVLAMLGISFVAMLVALDQTIVGTALPRIIADLKGFDLYAWVATSYMLASLVTIPIFGRLGDLFGRKRFLIAAIVLFTAASVLCAMAPGMLWLVIARGLQGIGGGILMGTAFATVADLFPDTRLRLRWLVFISSAFALANVVGPTLGGILTQYGGWRLVFFVNLPVGVVSLGFVWRFLPDLRAPLRAGPVTLDWIGACGLVVTFGLLQTLIEMGSKQGITLVTIALAVMTVIAVVCLWKWERRVAYPILPVDMLLDRKLAALFAMSVLEGFALFSLVFYVPLLFQGGFAMSPHDSGMLITPLLLGATAGGIVNNRIVMWLRRANPNLYAGFALFAGGALCLIAIGGSVPHAVWLGCMGSAGFGLGIVASNLTIFSQQIVTREHLGAATALLQSLRILGGMLGTVATGALLGSLYASGIHRTLASYQANQWFKSFSSPELLIDHAEQAALVARLISAGHAGESMMDSARVALIESIHIGMGLAAGAAILGLCLGWFVPPVRVSMD
jgi:EmrB/QacA subfamily drug resistance transporter